MTIPTRLRTQAGITAGDLVEASYSRGKIILTPKIDVDPAKFPTADDEYTPAQRWIINRAIAAGMEDFKKGRVHGPFSSAKEASTYIERMVKHRRARRVSKRPLR